MRSLVLAAAVLSAPPGLSAQEKKYESKEGKYAVAFPAAPQTESKKVGDLTMHTASAEGKGVGFMVIHADLPADAVKGAKAADILDNGEKGLVAGFKAKVVKSQDTTFGPDKLPARQVTGEVVVDATVLHVRLTLVVAGGRLYQVLAIGGKDAVFGKGADAFFESFELRR